MRVWATHSQEMRAIGSTPATKYVVEENTLFACGELSDFMDMTFEVELGTLLESESEDLIVDLMMVTTLSSPYIGQLFAFSQEAKRHERQVRVIATGKIAEVLRLAGVNNFLELIIR